MKAKKLQQEEGDEMRVKYIGETDPVCLINGKEYDVIDIDEDMGWYRVIDEEGEDPDEDVQGYLYPPEAFEIIEGSPDEFTQKTPNESITAWENCPYSIEEMMLYDFLFDDD